MGHKIRKLLDMEVHGNAAADTKLFDLAREIIMSETATLSQQRVAIRRINECMGYPNDRVGREDVEAYIEAHRNWSK